jgi:biotin transport system substrate-specific component
MHRILSIPISASANSTGAAGWLRTTGIILTGDALLAICAHLSVPLWFTPVPLSLQPFAVLLLGLLLSPGLAAATAGIYLVEGAAGLPVFAPTPLSVSGLAHLIGPNGGYLLAYPFAAALISILWRRTAHGIPGALASAAAGDLAILVTGTLWLAAESHVSIWTAFSLAALPFLPGDALKIAAASGVASTWQRLQRRNL